MSSIKSTFVMIAGVAANAMNASFLMDGLDQINVCNDCWCGCIHHKHIIVAGCP
jgi:hypothetical protein